MNEILDTIDNDVTDIEMSEKVKEFYLKAWRKMKSCKDNIFDVKSMEYFKKNEYENSGFIKHNVKNYRSISFN